MNVAKAWDISIQITELYCDWLKEESYIHKKFHHTIARWKERRCPRLYLSLLKYSFDFSQGLTILCDSSSIRLISSGSYENSVTITTEEAMENDMDYENNVIMVCPGYT